MNLPLKSPPASLIRVWFAMPSGAIRKFIGRPGKWKEDFGEGQLVPTSDEALLAVSEKENGTAIRLDGFTEMSAP